MPGSDADVSGVTSTTEVTGAPRITVHPCLKRQKPDSRFSHFTGTNAELIRSVTDNFQNKKPGRYEGSLVVTVPPDGKFFARVPKEAARPYEDSKPPAEIVYIILHSRQRIEEDDKERGLPLDVDWFVVSINAYPN